MEIRGKGHTELKHTNSIKYLLDFFEPNLKTSKMELVLVLATSATGSTQAFTLSTSLSSHEMQQTIDNSPKHNKKWKDKNHVICTDTRNVLCGIQFDVECNATYK